uniref:LAGLIDADG endonuclease n=1 Tax=Agaricus bitorquis TaxID=5343 RepID=UPI0027998E2B|nr:LAGLIDADG endonuclease [Agaricus bitorquis]WFG54039.1 LAGLIDADG endonuclease [Agaricus bitorquis]
MQIINLRASINLGLSNLQKSKIPNYNPVARPVINTTIIPDLNWLSGFVTAEGCFFLSIIKSNRTKVGYAIQLMFKLTQNKRDKELLKLIAKFVNCGAVYSKGENAFDFIVSKFADNLNIIIPIFKNYPIQGIKQLEYQDFCQVAALIDIGKHLTEEGLAKILLI